MNNRVSMKNKLNFRQQLGIERFNDEILNDWFNKLQPRGSGPLGIMKMACALIEEIKELQMEKTKNE